MLSALTRFWIFSGYARRRATAAVLQLIASSYYDTQVGGSATALFQLSNVGVALGGPGVLSGSGAYAWLSGGAPAAYQVVVTLTNGTFSTGAAGTFGLSTTRQWTVTRSSNGTTTATATFSIEAVANPGVSLASASITLTATISAGSGGGGGGDAPWDNPFGGGPNVN